MTCLESIYCQNEGLKLALDSIYTFSNQNLHLPLMDCTENDGNWRSHDKRDGVVWQLAFPQPRKHLSPLYISMASE